MVLYIVWRNGDSSKGDVSRFFPTFEEAKESCMLRASEYDLSYVLRVSTPTITKEVLCNILNGTLETKSTDRIFWAELRNGTVVGRRIGIE